MSATATNGLAVIQQPQHNLAPMNYSLGDKLKYAEALSRADMLPAAYRNKPGNVLLAMEVAEALSIRPALAIQMIHIIDGRSSASSALISSLVRRAGHKLRISCSNKVAKVSITRIDDPTFTYESTWDMPRAVNAGLASKDVWKKYPEAMLKARAITECARDACQEALCGVQYTPEELGAEVTVDGEPVVVEVMRGVRESERANVIENGPVDDGKEAALEALRKLGRAFPVGTLVPFLAGRDPKQMTVAAIEVLYREMHAHLSSLTDPGERLINLAGQDPPPPPVDAKATAIKRFWAVTHEVGLSEQETRFALREFDLVARDDKGVHSVSLSSPEVINKAADWFTTCDPIAIRTGFQNEQNQELDVDF